MSVLDIPIDVFLGLKVPANGNKEDSKVLVSILRNWTQSSYTSGHVARDLKGRACGYDAPHAIQWDCYGILLKYSQSIEQADRIAAFMESHRALSNESLVTWGDDKHFYEVIPIFRDTAGFLAELSQRELTLKEITS